MAFTFYIEKPADVPATLEKLKEHVAQNKGKIYGDNTRGAIFINGGEGVYIVQEASIKIIVSKKPSALIPNRMVENEIRKIFREVSR